MKVAIKDLRKRPTHYIELARKGADITLTNRGSAVARIVPCKASDAPADTLDPLFGIWQDRDDIDDPLAYVQGLRKARSFR